MEVLIKIQNQSGRNPEEKTADKEVITVHNLVILDESGSMSAIYGPALSGCNETIQSVRAADSRYANQSHRFTFVTFNSYGTKTVLDDVPIGEVRRLTEKDYDPEGCTPLYDAIGSAVKALERKVEEGDRVLVTIITDGEENDSREYSAEAVREMADRLRTRGWTFALIGANQDASRVARTLDIRSSLDFKATAEGTREMYRRCRKGHDGFFEKLSELGRDMLSCDDLDF